MKRAWTKVNRVLWEATLKVPVLKPLLLIVNSYVWMGDPRALLFYAPAHLYLTRILLKLALIFLACFDFVLIGQSYDWGKLEAVGTIDIALQLFPNVLGFGIGAYALLFTFPERFFSSLEDRKDARKRSVGAFGLNAIAAFPLVAIAVIIGAAVILKTVQLPAVFGDIAGLFLIAYGMLLTIELVAVLFVSARQLIRSTLSQATNELKRGPYRLRGSRSLKNPRR